MPDRLRLTFRPTEKAVEVIQGYMKEHNIESRSQAVTEIVEKSGDRMKEEGASGQLISCPMRRYPLRLESGLCEGVRPMALVDTSVCKTCPKKPCETWKNIESEKRLSRKAGMTDANLNIGGITHAR